VGRPKGGKNRKWTNEERLKYVLLCEEELLSPEYVERNYGVSAGTLRGWIKRYRRGGIDALNPKKLHPGNKFAALHTCKSLSTEDELRLLVEKLEVENERLKKGYIVKGVGADKVFVTLKELNSK